MIKVFHLLLIPALINCPALLACSADHTDENLQVRHVHDGDTLVLQDGRKVRIVGIDTPELSRKQTPAEPLAIQARDFLRQHIKPGSFIKIRYDSEKTDRYGRMLGHVFLDNDKNVSKLLLQSGFAHVLLLPPNLWSDNCYLQTQASARKQKRGLWQLASHQAIVLAELDAVEKSTYSVLIGTVHSIQHQKNISKIILKNRNNKLAVIVGSENRNLFNKLFSLLKPGVELEVQGRVKKSRYGPYIRIYHPGVLQINPH